MKLSEATLLLPDIFLPLTGHTLDLHYSAEALQPGDAIFSIGPYQLPKPFSKASLYSETLYLLTTKSRHFQSQVSYVAALVSMALGTPAQG